MKRYGSNNMPNSILSRRGSLAEFHQSYAYVYGGEYSNTTEGYSIEPILDSKGLRVGMLRGCKGDTNGIFVNSGALMDMLSFLKGPSMTYKDWGIKVIVSSVPKHEAYPSSRKRRAPEDDEPKTKRQATSTEFNMQSRGTRERYPHFIPKPSWKPPVLHLICRRVA
jgi:hypothetical protein